MRSRQLPVGRHPKRWILFLSAVGAGALGSGHLLAASAAAPASVSSAGVQLLSTATAPAITAPPRSQSLVVNLPATLEVVATGDAPLSYAWSKDGTNLVSTTNLVVVTNTRLSFSPFTTNDAGAYRVTVSNAAGSVTSEPATLTLLPNPAITQPPQSQIVIEGSTVALSVGAQGSTPLTFYWSQDGSNLITLSTSALVFVPVSTNNAGVYQVTVSNAVGTATSEPFFLAVKPNTPRQLRVVDWEQPDPTRVRLPITLAAQGDEARLGFSLHFNPAVLQDPTLTLTAEAAALLPGATVEVNDLDAAEGRVGWSVALPPGQRMPAQTFRLAEAAFTLANPAWREAELAFGSSPTPLGAADGEGGGLPVLDWIDPFVKPGALAEVPDAQSGLFEQRLTLANASAYPISGLQVLVRGLGEDSLGMARRLANASGATNGVPYVYYGPLWPGQEVELNLGYYVADRRSPPMPEFEVRSVPAQEFMATGGLVFTITSVRLVEGRAILEFLSLAGRRYFIQYVDAFGSIAWKTAQPEIRGTGARVQWIDDGPPKTTSRPTSEGSRFYRGMLMP
ncbi:MAG: immunoglobulin domain-containing protein [Verrucomicrobiales bacterium]|nr:immunoglobulin domain-containing protein [Verrucomicrobiales bacterium]